ncbi:hypothetical protein K443DRAFT_680823 [Laccaria amethystina LaAM-08-1]|uniref:Unplaced genomic scaffold K443scaffold_135, whole genome shotgun sequence n=1 Tax=Laccaria amethystina LaAM-08-1 TaxID=1095629 RepID=A0A0C9XLE9_9AGAR|nr:hypothetical protein K443DRAFT_680823 [Laccaria amethystina LaAM-08-1]
MGETTSQLDQRSTCPPHHHACSAEHTTQTNSTPDVRGSVGNARDVLDITKPLVLPPQVSNT